MSTSIFDLFSINRLTRFRVRLLLLLIILSWTLAAPRINLHYTDWIDEEKQDLQHDCVRIPISNQASAIVHEVMTYCISDLPSAFHVQQDSTFPSFTFAELSARNITSEELFLWSASIDLVERYQIYLNQILMANNTETGSEVFYNCTFPRFGPVCQYEIQYYHPRHSTLYDIIKDDYSFTYNVTSFTCYIHLQCNRGRFPVCLDWTEICNGVIDCLDTGADEADCWQLEINQCNDDEFQCKNGQCIPKSFERDYSDTPDCQDGSDERISKSELDVCSRNPSTFQCEDSLCSIGVWTASCLKERDILILDTLYANDKQSVSKICAEVFRCIMKYTSSYPVHCNKICQPLLCLDIIRNQCPEMFFFPEVPLFSSQFRIAHTRNDSFTFANGNIASPYLCYIDSRYDRYFINQKQVIFLNETCVRPSWPPNHLLLFYTQKNLYYSILFDLFRILTKYNIMYNYTSEICNRVNMYQCANSSQCISVNRILNGMNDCPQNDDEDVTKINEHYLQTFLKNHFKCELSNKYIHRSNVEDGICDCQSSAYSSFCEDEDIRFRYTIKRASFQLLCDGLTQLMPILIEGKNETDETECQHWPCDNLYSRCNRIWNCQRGEDETDCYRYSTLNCSLDHHMCVSPYTNELMCLPIEKANDGNIDCLGATDEGSLCTKTNEIFISKEFYCKQKKYYPCTDYMSLCDNFKDCDYGEDEQFCNKNITKQVSDLSICHPLHTSLRSDVEYFLCEKTTHKIVENVKHFTLQGLADTAKDVAGTMSTVKSSIVNRSAISYTRERDNCNRGLGIRVWLGHKDNLTVQACLCPSSYYGSQCQYQTQRISLTVRFQALADSWSTVFTIIISLIDDHQDRIIHSFEQLTYISVRDCKIKFNMHLLYSTRPNDSKRNHSIHIDIFEKVSLAYRGSLLFPLKFPFLPIQRVALIALIPRKNDNFRTCSNSQCVHGMCTLYSNSPTGASFCYCDRGWSGQFCNISRECNCSLDSICLGISAYNRSVCACPLHKFGSQCLLTNSVCHTNQHLKCMHGGQCVPADEHTSANRTYRCICLKGYVGDRCEIIENKIAFSFESSITLSQSIFIHFIEVFKNDKPKRTTTFRSKPLLNTSLTMYWSKPFHLIFIELYQKEYYFAFIQTAYTRSVPINPIIRPSDHCKHINEIFNQTMLTMHALRRLKHYHLPCQTLVPNETCFYDDVRICFCYDDRRERLTNCFEFNHNMTFNCLGQSVCENDGQCFQDSPDCPERFTCICQPCFYGRLCQFSSGGFGLSLDAIIGYHIQPHVKLTNQPNIVKVAFALTVIFLIAGYANGILSLITFSKKAVYEVGSGIYLLESSITTMITTTAFGLKSFILILAQIKMISNVSCLKMQCSSLDFILRVGLSLDQWLNACIAVERTCVVMQSTSFNKKRSQYVAKLVSSMVLMFVIGSNIYDPIYRRLIDEENDGETRLWCIALYPPALQIINSIINAVHFAVPFLINFVSTIVLLMKVSRQRGCLNENRTYRRILLQQIQKQKHLLISPVVLVILGVPRFVITLVSKCMKSTDDAWIFLAGYFISFLPPLLTFIIFVLPSKAYRREFHKSINQLQTLFMRYSR